MIYGIILIVLGLLAVPSLVVSRKPDAKEWLDKLVPIQGWLGLLVAIAGIWGIISCIIHIRLLGIIPIYWATWLVVSIVEAALGLIMGYGLIQKYALSKNAEAAAKGEKVLAKLMPLQGTLGILAIILGIWQVIASFLWVLA